MIGRTFSHYRVIERLGAGGMGEVYKAHDQHLDREVAIKVLPAGTLDDEEARRRFRREAKALSRLNHAHIATVHDFDSADGVDFLVMEYVAGRALSDHIGQSPLPEREIAGYGSDVAAALEEAHERGVIHRDLKPANMIVTPKGHVKVLDFGVAHLSGTAADVEQTATQTGGFAGTLPYMAPEQVRGEAIDARTDIYALGVVLFEMATGRRPFNETHTGRLTDAILHTPVMPPSQLQPRLNPELERIILKCLERDPERRYQSSKEVAIDLRRLASPTTAPSPLSGAARRWSGRRAVLTAAAAIVVLSSAAVGWIATRDGDPPSSTAPDAVASIVVLPSKILAQASDQFLTDAIPNTISAHLTQVTGLETKVPPSSVEVERVSGDLGRLADAYGVSAFVLSSVSAEADRLVLNVQLVDARSRRLLWSRDFEGQRGSYLAMARGAAEELRAAVRPNAASLAPRPGTSSSEAELAYQRGMHHFNRYNNQHEKSDFDRGLAAFEEALKIDPRMADAASGIAWLHEFAIEAGTPVERKLSDVRRWAQRAVDLDPGNSRGWAALAVAALIGKPPRPREGIAYALRAATTGPRDAFAVNGSSIALWGASSTLALAGAEEAARLDPLFLYPPLNASELFVYLNRPAEALERADAVLRLEPDMPGALIRKAFALIELRRGADAAALLPTLRRQAGEGRADPEFVAIIEDAVALLQDDADAKRVALDRLERQALNPGPFAEYPRVYVWLVREGRTAAALNALEQRARVGRVPYDLLHLTPELNALATNERYARILATARAEFESTVSLLREAEGRGELPFFLQQSLADLLRTVGLSHARAATVLPQTPGAAQGTDLDRRKATLTSPRESASRDASRRTPSR